MVGDIKNKKESDYMAFFIPQKENCSYSTPQEMFQDNKLKCIKGILDYQSEILDSYMKTLQNETIRDKNVAFEMPTGSGKTLIGVLIAEFHRRKYNRRALFLCPTNQLVEQVCRQANNQYGISAIAFTGKQKDYSPYDKTRFLTQKAIGVTTYSSFFSFGTIFDGTDILVFDDVHSSESYIADNWTLEIDRFENTTLFSQIVEVLSDILSESDILRLRSEDNENGDIKEWNNMVPRQFLLKKDTALQEVISEGVKHSNMIYAWQRISDNLINCQLYISWRSILIRPFIAPTEMHPIFNKTKQRIFMSATLGNSGELERITGCSKIKRLPVVSDWDKKGLGRKLFIFPGLSAITEPNEKIITALHQLARRSVLIVSSTAEANHFSEHLSQNIEGLHLFKANNLINEKKQYIDASNAMVIMANRFDGVDFPDDECRMLFIYNLHKYTHLQEKFFVNKMAASVLFTERIKSRIVQAVGRCTRNAGDYSVVCVLGNSILSDMTTSDIQKNYHPELRAEIEFGVENSTKYKSIDNILENVKLFLERNNEWADIEQYFVNRRDEFALEKSNRQEIFEQLFHSAELEVKIQYDLWKHNYQEAFGKVIEVINFMNSPSLKGYKCFWQYMAGSLAVENGHIQKANQLFEEAIKNNKGSIKWLSRLIINSQNTVFQVRDNYFYDVVEELENEICSNPTNRFEKLVKEILDNLQCQDGEKFELAHQKLGQLLGYNSHNSKETAAPDPYWIVNEHLCIVAEDKIYDDDDKEIPIKHVRQAKDHEGWIKSNVNSLSPDAEIITVFISNSSSIESAAANSAGDLYYINRNDFVKWATKSINVLRKVRSYFCETGDSGWRENAENDFINAQVTPLDFIFLLKKRKLSEL